MFFIQHKRKLIVEVSKIVLSRVVDVFARNVSMEANVWVKTNGFGCNTDKTWGFEGTILTVLNVRPLNQRTVYVAAAGLKIRRLFLLFCWPKCWKEKFVLSLEYNQIFKQIWSISQSHRKIILMWSIILKCYWVNK